MAGRQRQLVLLTRAARRQDSPYSNAFPLRSTLDQRQLRMSAQAWLMYKISARRDPELGLPRGQLVTEFLIIAR
jgi:hypothetical protein